MSRPRPPIVQPAEQHLPVPAPEDATVLFDGENLDAWQSAEGGPPRWEIRDGALVSVPDSGYVYSEQPFGDVQLHLEWATPSPAEGIGQGRGNSGVFLMSNYEVQILDSYENETYADGQAASVYGQYPPLVNACRPPGEWQSYDIVFRGPRFLRDGQLASPARMTVIHNGILVQDNVELWGPTSWLQHQPYQLHPEKLPIGLQDHGNPVRFRNIWLRELPAWDEPGPRHDSPERVVSLTPAELAAYAGRYQTKEGDEYLLTVEDGVLTAIFFRSVPIELVPRSRTEFALRWTDARLVFDMDDEGQPTGFVFHIGRHPRRVEKME